MIVQVSFIDKNSAETWTLTHDFDTIHDVTDYLLERPPENLAVNDTYLVHVMVGEGQNLYFKGWQGAWELINSSDYDHTWRHEREASLETKKRLDQLRAEGAVKPVEASTPEQQEKLEKARQAAEDSPRRRKERYQVR